MKPILIAIDLMGCIAYINEAPYCYFLPDKVEDIKEYLEFIKEKGECIAIVEKVSLNRQDMNTSKYRYLTKYAKKQHEVTTILRLMKLPYILIYPIQWVSYFYLSDPDFPTLKKHVQMKAESIYSYKVDVQNCDALLMLEYLRQRGVNKDWLRARIPNSIEI